jgi:hypothetical protein
MNSNVTHNSFDDEVIDGVVGHPGPPARPPHDNQPFPHRKDRVAWRCGAPPPDLVTSSTGRNRSGVMPGTVRFARPGRVCRTSTLPRKRTFVRHLAMSGKCQKADMPCSNISRTKLWRVMPRQARPREGGRAPLQRLESLLISDSRWFPQWVAPSTLSSAFAAFHSIKIRRQSRSADLNRRSASCCLPFRSANAPL